MPMTERSYTHNAKCHSCARARSKRTPPGKTPTRHHSQANPFDWATHIEAVAADIFGACNEAMSREPEDVRFGNKGSVSVDYTKGIWYDHESERGGGVKGVAVQIFPILGEATATVEPGDRAFDDPTLG
jgi:hypothetical protein